MRPITPWTALAILTIACLPEEQASFDPTTSSTSSLTAVESTGPDVPTDATGVDKNSSSSGEIETSTSGNPDDTTTLSETPVCGDGVVDPGEECDLGDALNVETGACLPNCVLATCGDGFVQTAVEQCDLGTSNSHNYGGCLPETCFWGPACGDGEVTPGHEICDPGAPVDPMGGEFLPCGPDCRFDGRVAFLSSDAYNGKEVGGLTGADSKCRQLARAFDLDRFHTYRAWLSDGTGEPASTFDPANVPYVLLNGVMIADSFEDLLLSGPDVGITITDKHESVDDVLVWTHTTEVGTKIPDEHHCSQWTSEDFGQVAMCGRNSVSADLQQTWDAASWWTRYVEDVCNKQRHLYCFEN